MVSEVNWPQYSDLERNVLRAGFEAMLEYEWETNKSKIPVEILGRVLVDPDCVLISIEGQKNWAIACGSDWDGAVIGESPRICIRIKQKKGPDVGTILEHFR